MEFSESLRTAWSTLRSNRLRAALTLLSVAIGVFSIIAVMTALGALQNSIESGLSELGANTFQIQKFPPHMGGGPEWRERYRNRQNLMYDDGLRVIESVHSAKTIGLESWHFGVEVSWKHVRTDPNISVAGETTGGLATNQWEVELGRGLLQPDVDHERAVAVLGYDLARRLFPPSINPIGETVRMGGVSYSVIGVLKQRGGLFGNQERYFIIPISTFFARFGKNRSIHIMVQAPSRETFEAVQDDVVGVLRAAHKVPPGEENDFAIFSNESVITEFNALTSSVRLGTMAIAAVALLAAGIGIMNIMLVSVTERTREIGVRKAVGARKRAIVWQFLSEAVFITLIGGVIGIVAGLVAGNVLALVLGIDIVVQVGWIFFGLLACLLIGVVFGTYPAWKASNLDPIEALRFE